MTHKLKRIAEAPALRIATIAILVLSLIGLGWGINKIMQPDPSKPHFVPQSLRLPQPAITVTSPPRIIVKTVIKKVPGPVRTVYVSRSKVRTPIVTKTYPTLSTNQYKSYIYMRESGNNPTRYSSSGCLGLGQACPGSKLLNVCPTMSYSCEDAWFTNYAISRYGSWAGAYNFWINNHWW